MILNKQIINYFYYKNKNLQIKSCKDNIKSHDNMPTFMSGTDLNTLQEEGSDMNNFLSLIVNNAGQYTAAITRKVKHIPRVKETLEYEFFGEGIINLGTDEYDAVESYEIECFFLDIKKPTVNICYTNLFDRINEISNNKVINISSKNESFKTIHNPNANLIIPSTVQEPILEGKLPFEGLPKAEVDEEEEFIDYDSVKFNNNQLNSITKQLLMGSPIFNPKDLNEWVDKMPTAFSKRFGEGQKGLENYKAFIGYFVEFLLSEAFDEDLAEEGYMEDYQMPICAYGVLQKLHQFKSNSFLNIIEEEVERFII